MNEDAMLAALLSVWKTQVCSVHIPTLVTVDEAVRIVEAARGEQD